MNKHLYSQNTLLVLFVWLLNLTTAQAALLIEPDSPTVSTGCSIQLTVSGAVGKVGWQVLPREGSISGEGTKVDYVAPNEEGKYRIVALDKATGDGDIVDIEVVTSQTECPLLQSRNNSSAVILIHSSTTGIEGSIQIEENILEMGKHIYDTFLYRGYQENEIYITPFNSTFKEAFEKAKQQSDTAKAENLPEEPLVVIFIGDGLPDNLVLTSSDDLLSEQTLDGLLDEFQKATDNKVVVIIDAPYSGTLIDALKGDNRVIVTSTNDTEYNNTGENAFSKFYFDQLHTGANYWAAWELVTNIYNHPNNFKFNQQQPQLEDTLNGELAQQLCLNDCFYGLPGPVLTIRLKGNSAEPTIELGGHRAIMPKQRTNFLAEIDVHDAQSVEILVESSYSPTLSIPFFFTKDDGEWQPSYNPIFSMDTTYIVTAKVNGEIVATSPVSFFVITQPHLIGNRLYIPAVAVGNTYYQVELFKHSDSQFELDLALVNDLLSAENIDDSVKTVSFINNHVLMESLIIDDGSTVNAKLELLNDPQNPWLFELIY